MEVKGMLGIHRKPQSQGDKRRKRQKVYGREKWFTGWVSVQVKGKGVPALSSNWLRKLREFDFSSLTKSELLPHKKW